VTLFLQADPEFEAVYSSETLVSTFNFIWCHNPEDHNSILYFFVIYTHFSPIFLFQFIFFTPDVKVHPWTSQARRMNT
jgi:hypothetical protein